MQSIKEPEGGRRTQTLFGGKRGGPPTYQAIPTTNFLQPKVLQQGFYRDVTLRTTTQQLPNTRIVNIGGHSHSHAHQQQASYKDSETEEMFGSSELNTMHPVNIPIQTRGVTQATFGYEPRVPMVTVGGNFEGIRGNEELD